MTDLHFNAHIQTLKRPARRPSTSQLQADLGLDTVHQLSQNENPLGPSPKVIAALAEVAPSLSYYPDFSDIELRQAIVDVLDADLTPDMIYVGCSGFEALELITRGFVREGDECIYSSPGFLGAYGKITTLQSATLIDVPLKPETFAYDVDAVLNAITERTKIIFICNPNNPTGNVIPAETMDTLMQNIPAHVIVVADEVYHHFVDDPDYPNSYQYLHEGRNIIITHSFSKAYGLAGLRLGYGIARPEIADYLGSMHRGFHINKLAMAAGVAACKDREHLKYIVEYINDEKAWLLPQLDSLDIRYWQPAANFILMETALTAQDITARLQQQGILVRPQHKNGLPHAIRVSIGTHEANRAFIIALKKILSENA